MTTKGREVSGTITVEEYRRRHGDFTDRPAPWWMDKPRVVEEAEPQPVELPPRRRLVRVGSQPKTDGDE
jgi:hypothetical protein